MSFEGKLLVGAGDVIALTAEFHKDGSGKLKTDPQIGNRAMSCVHTGPQQPPLDVHLANFDQDGNTIVQLHSGKSSVGSEGSFSLKIERKIEGICDGALVVFTFHESNVEFTWTGSGAPEVTFSGLDKVNHTAKADKFQLLGSQEFEESTSHPFLVFAYMNCTVTLDMAWEVLVPNISGKLKSVVFTDRSKLICR